MLLAKYEVIDMNLVDYDSSEKFSSTDDDELVPIVANRHTSESPLGTLGQG